MSQPNFCKVKLAKLRSTTCFKGMLLVFLLLSTCFVQAQTPETFPVGSKIINMGVVPQTVANGLKPYGLVYALLKANIPVKWIINPNKVKDGVDFSHNGVDYKGSAFVVSADFLSPSIIAIFNTWTAKGVIVNSTVSPLTVGVTYTIKTAPFWVMDAQNGRIAVAFLDAAEIPSTAYIFKEPSQLTGCDDIYVMPHADPTWETHKNLFYWNLTYKGAFWGGCHAVSVLENTYGKDIYDTSITRRLNFLMNDGTAGVDKNAVLFSNHANGSPPYLQNYPANPVMQFIGTTDAAQQGGSEQIFMPYKPGGSWRPTSNIGVYDPSQADIPLKSDGAAATVIFGRAYGDPNRGQVVYQGGHNIGGSSPANVAAQRVFFNSSFQFVLDKQLSTTLSNVTLKMNGNVTYNNFTIAAFSPIPNNTLKYQWSSTAGGTFSNPTGTVTNYTPPIVTSVTTAVITCVVTDACGRVSGESQGVTILPGPLPPTALPDSAVVPRCAGNLVTFNVLSNDFDYNGDAMTVTLLGQGSYGTFTNQGNGIITYSPVSYAGSYDMVQYQNCDNTGLCTISTVKAIINLKDGYGCNPDEYYGVAQTISALRGTAITGVPSNIAGSLDEGDGVTTDASTYTSFTVNNNVVVYALSGTVPALGQLRLYVDASANGKTFTVEQSSDSTNWTNSTTFTANSTDDFLEINKKSYTVYTGAKYIRFKNLSSDIYLDAMEYDVYSCVSSSPALGADGATTLEDVPVTIEVLANDSDPLGKPFVVSGVTIPPTHGSVSINPDFTITYLNNKDQNATDSFTYKVVNSGGLVSTAKVIIKIVADGCGANKYKPFSASSTTVTLLPIADTYFKQGSPTTNYGTSNDLRFKGKTADLKRPLFQFDLSSIPAGSIIDTASFSAYMSSAPANENANIYIMSRSWQELSATWNTFNPGGSWATAGGDFSSTVWASKSTGTVSNIYINWNLKSLVQNWVSGTLTNNGFIIKRYPEGGIGTFKDNNFKSRENGSNNPKLYVRYLSPASCTNIPLRAAMAVPDTATTNSITPVTINVAANDYNYSGNAVTISRISLTSKKGGTITQSGNNLIYTPPATSPTFNGVDTFMYKITTNSLADSAVVYVDVINAPPSANVDNYTLQSNTNTTPTSVTANVRANDSDPEGSSLTIPTITVQPKKGTVAVDGSGNLVYTPSTNYYGTDSLVYSVGEAITGCNPFSDTAKVIFTITNRNPIGVNDVGSTNPCEIKQFRVLNNDSDPEGGEMAITITTPPGVGTATLTNKGTIIKYTPPAGVSNVTTTLQYQVCDDANPAACSNITTLTITINPTTINNPPIAIRDSFSTPINEVVYADVLSNDSEPDGQDFLLPLTIVTSPTKGTVTPLANGLIKYTPNYNVYGVDSFQYRVYDDVPTVSHASCVVIPSQSATAWAYIVIQGSPLATFDYVYVHKNTTANLNVLANDIFGADGPGTGTISVLTIPKGGTATVLAGALPTQADDLIRYVPTANFASNDTLIYQICDATGDCDTAIVYIKYYPDTDGDGIDDTIDIDDDNDGVPDVLEACGTGATSFVCVVSGTDPSLDDDLDGVLNYKDADYGTLNTKGTVSIFDADSDGIPDFLDLDSDNDGIPDVVEAGGVDANGDGIIDNFTDTDADGFSQNVDGNNTGAAGSGNGLGLPDFDSDGVANYRDLDSDNDGIPDVLEVVATDANNDGMTDTFIDANYNGFNDAYESAGALLATGADTNNDGRADSYPNKNTDQLGKANPYDLDADGDGITDALEAGFAASVTVSNGIVTGAMTNGWANSVKALGTSALNLANTDGRGRANFIDIDSDDDGISDNIEGQATASYIIPTNTDADSDGINDVYETLIGTYGGEGITANDQDADGTPDYKDTDADNDGLLDLNEASKISTLTQANINVTDTDNDGLVDQFDILNVKTALAAAIPYNVASSNMGANGSLTGPATSGSNVLLIQSFAYFTNRDWRILNTLNLGNHVWYDFNGNSLKDATEAGIANAVVNIYLDTDGNNLPDGGAVISTTTDATGTYQFAGLSANKYIVGVVLPSGYAIGNAVATSANPNNAVDNDNNGVNIAGTEVRSNNINLTVTSNTLDIGLIGTGSSGNFVWYDANANGIQDAGETGISGATVSITNSTGMTLTTTTNASGDYTFGNLAPGTYTFVYTTPAGHVASPAAQGSDNALDSDPVSGSVTVTFTAGQIRTNVDAGFYQLVNLGNTVWFDANGNGIKDATEPGLSGATVKIYVDANNDNVADGAALATTTTNGSGIYAFANLVPNNYIVGVTLPTGYAIVPTNGGDPDNNTDNDNNGITLVGSEVRSNAITLTSSGEPSTDGDGTNGNLTLDIAVRGTGSIGDFVWNDINGNGIQDAGETGLSGVTVSINAASIGTLTAITDAAGAYQFPNLPIGTFTLTFTTPSGYFASAAGQGADVTKNSDPVSGTVSVTLTAGQVKTDIDAGFYLPFTLGSHVWYDFNKNGTYEVGESHLSGLTVNLYLDANADNNADGGTVIATTTTDASGNYQFANLASGKYIVGVVPPLGYALGTAIATTASPDNDVDEDNNGVKTASGTVRTNYISINENNSTLDIGLIGNATLGNFIWNDTNGNGVQDNGEPGLTGVVVTLTNSNGFSTITTNAAGAYAFTDIAPGNYTVSFATPAGLFASPSLKGGNTTKDSDPVNGSVAITLVSGQTNNDVDAGFFSGYTLGNKVWFDVNNNGLLGAGEGGFSGMTVNMYQDANADNLPDGAAVATTTTDASGTYSFTQVPPGTYVLGVVLPAGYTATATTATSADPNNLTDNDNNGVTTTGGELFTNNILLSSLNSTVDIGIKGGGSIANIVFNDLNNDGIQDAGEPGMSGVTVTLTIGTTTVTTTTNGSGNYSFVNLVPGTYSIAFTTPAGYVASPANQGSDDTKDSDPVGGVVSVSVAPSQAVNDVAAGFFVPSTLGDMVWYDYNLNGTKDAGEPFVNGATVNLYKDVNGDNIADGAAVATTTTNATGNFSFTGLQIGKYIVGVTLNGYQAGATIATSANPGNNVDNDNNGIVTAGAEVRTNYIQLSGTNNTLDIGLGGTSSIGDFVWNDVNGNGIQDAGETGLQNVTVSLGNGTITLTTTTNSSGAYSFANLAPGTYTTTFTTPAGYFVSPSGQGANAALNSDPVSGSVAITVTAGQLRTDIDAGFYIPFTLGNNVWFDINRNGVKDANETVMVGATVKLYADANADNSVDGSALATTTTDASGNYQFANLASGNYIIGVTMPSGYALGVTAATSTTPNNFIDDDNNAVRTANGEARTNYMALDRTTNTMDIGLSGTGSIGNIVFFDANGNGIQDGGAETGLAGVAVSLTNSLGLTLTSTTNSTGIYSFSNLAPGTYTVAFVTPSGYYVSPSKQGTNDTKDSDPVSGSVSVTLTAGQSNNDVDAGYYLPFTIGDQVFYDFNKNGLFTAGEPGISGAIVKLYADNNSDNVPDGAAISTTLTDADGEYAFTGLTAGKYIVGVEVLAGYAPGVTTTNSANPNSGTDNDNNGVNLVGSEIRSNFITVSGSTSALDFGFKGTGNIGDYTWLDENGNGVQDFGELPLSGVKVIVTNSNGLSLSSVNTSALGLYSFTDIAPGTYTITFTTPNGYILTTPSIGPDFTKDSDPTETTGNDAATTFTVTAGEAATYIDAGYYLPFPLGNLVFYDINNNGVKDANEKGIAGLTVNLYKDANYDNIPDGSGSAFKTATTDINGGYLFTDLRANGYIVGVVLPAGYTKGATVSTSSDPNNFVDNDNNGVNLVGSIVRSNYMDVQKPEFNLDFGLKGTGSIGDKVWLDANANGLQDAGETGLAGVAITLTHSSGVSIATTSNASGAYSFTGLIPGTYTVNFATPTDYTSSPANIGVNDAIDSDPVGGNVTVVLTAGQLNVDVDAGYNQTLNIGNTIFYDINNNGLLDAGETGISGATVKLYIDANANNVPDVAAALLTTTTDASGTYLFSNLTNGNYIVGVTIPSGYVAAATTATSANPNNNVNNDNNGVTTVSGELRTNYLSLSSTNNTLDIGLTGTGSIGDLTWNDISENGTQGASEPGLAGITVTLTYTGGPTLTTTSNASGIYGFSNLAPGTYTLSYTTPFGYFPSAGLAGGDRTKDSDPVNGVTSVVITAGQIRTDVDAGFYLARTVGDMVFNDFNNNGVRDTNEPGISGATVKLYKDGNRNNIPDGAAIATTTTDANGNYQFSKLAINEYIVGVTLPAGYANGAITATSANPANNVDDDNNGVTLFGTEIRSNFLDLQVSNGTLDFGLIGTGSIGNFVWNDLNGNGVQNAGEPGFNNVQVSLAYGSLSVTTFTDASGNYSFTNLAPGSYTISFASPSGYFSSAAAQGGNTALDSDPVNGSKTITLAAAEANTGVDAGFYQAFGIGNLVWYDYNNNGIKDATETGMSGLTINLYADVDADNVADGSAVATTVTDASGAYQFSNLPGGIYIVGVVTPAGYSSGITTATSDDPNNNTDNDNNGVVTSGSEVRTNYISVNAVVNTVDIALKGVGSIGNFIWNDINGNGIQDAGEAGIGGVSVTITNSGGTSATITSNSSGFYSFSNLPPGMYTVAFAAPTGYIASPVAQGGDATLDSDPTGGSVSVNLTAGQTKTDVDAGFYIPFTLGNRIWYDFNNNGTRENAGGETGLIGATVKLYADANADNVADGAALATTTTDATGLYQFTNLQSGKYIVGVVMPSGYALGTTIATSSNPNNLVDNDNNGMRLTSGEIRTNYITLSASTSTLDIGLSGTGSIGDLVFNDVNGNGIQDAGETGLQGVTVSLTNGGGMSITTSSNALSNYAFTNLAPGTYTIAFTTPAGYVASPSLQGSDNTKDSDPANGTASVVIAAGQVSNTVDAGFYQPFTLSNTVWYDFNNNGTKDAAETGVSAATINLYIDANADNIPDGAAVATTATDASGNYQFLNVSSGKYLIGVVYPSGYTKGATTAGSATPNNNIDNDNNGVTIAGAEITTNNFNLNASNSTIDIGLNGSGSIGEFVWLDTNGNGVQDAGELGMANVAVSLTTSGGKVLSTTTDASGHYSFVSLIPDTYTVHFTTPSVAGAPKVIPYIIRQPHAGANAAIDSDPVAATGSATVVLGAGEINNDIDAGYARDQDDDKDGIPNIIENNGYDPFADNDGDGIVNYLDPTQIDLLPGNSLVWKDLNNDGINDYFDFDLDGILNELDLDSDNDGITDIRETRDGRATDVNQDALADGVDADGDGIMSSADIDDNTYSSVGLTAQDLDGDNKANYLDLDSDGDGITDYTEATGLASTKGMVIGADSDADGILAESFGSNNATVADNISGAGGKGITLRDSDADGIPDAYDLDSDADGIADNREGQTSAGFVAGSATDTDGDGLADSYDSFNGLGGAGVSPTDTDADGVADIIDLDSDNDGIADVIEWQLGSSYVAATLADADADGLADVFDALPNMFGGAKTIQDSDGDTKPDFRDKDSDNDGIADVVEAYGVDANGDGIIDNFSDADGDGLSQNVDGNNTGINGSGTGLGFNDLDGDGVRNSIDLDSDNDGIPDLVEAGGADANNNGRVDSFVDANGNGLADTYETSGALLTTGADNNNDGKADSYPTKNTDGAGLANPYDLDSDGDGLPDRVEAGFAGNGGIVDGTKGADGWSVDIQALTALSMPNTDGNGPLDYLDIDSDNDGIGDNVEWQSGLYVAPVGTDTDGDGIADVYDTKPAVYGGGRTAVDTDGDGVADMKDLDSDNDGIADMVEWQLMTAYVSPTLADTDNDGLLNVYDALPNAFNGIKTPLDTDGDGVADFRDMDSDNDGVADVVEAFGVDENGDGIIDNFSDGDGDGLSQNVDGYTAGIASSGVGLGYVDFDGDGIPNNLDLDSDNDGVPDVLEVGGVDNNNDGRVDSFADADGDGWKDALDNLNSLLKTGSDNNGDGKADSYPFKNADYVAKPNLYSLDSDGDGIADAVEAGFGLGITVTNGMATGGKTNGWANAVKNSSTEALVLVNTDGRGQPNLYDIDSDDDGIPDNVEGQATFSFIVKTDTDSDGDGIADVYDVNVNTFGASGITPFDDDADGTPDYIDLDTDNDGAPDINEASKYLTMTADNINSADTDGDGLLDEFDNIDVRSMANGKAYLNISNSNMGPGGNFNGPFPSGSNVKLTRSLASGDRDWRSISILALNVVSFTGTLTNNQATLVWKVQNETDIDHYELQRSEDAVHFSKVANVKASNAGTYSYPDDVSNVNAPYVYYRVKQVNKSGNEYLTNVVAFKLEEANSYTLKAFPNPFVSELHLTITSKLAGNAVIKMMDMRGRALLIKPAKIESGKNQVDISNLGVIAHGMFIVEVSLNGKILAEKVVRQ